MNSLKNFSKGFNLLELLVVIAIISVLAAIFFGILRNAKGRGADAVVKSNLVNATRQAEIFYATNDSPDGYHGVCNMAPVGGTDTLYEFLMAAAEATGLSTYSINSTGSTFTVTCNAAANSWAAEAPLQTPGEMWCVDSFGKSKETSGSNLTNANDRACN